jgi:hypothetical protein
MFGRPLGVRVVGGAVALLAAVAGCSAAGTASQPAATGAVSPTTAASSPVPSATSAAPAAPAALDGSVLNSDLLPASDMPHGFAVISSATTNGGSALPEDSPSPVPAAQLCTTLSETAWIRAAGVTTADFAETSFGNSSDTEEISEEIDAFQGTDAQRAMTALWQSFGRCHTFTETSSGVTAAMTLTKSTIGGHWAGIKAVQLSPSYDGGTTIVAVRVGYSIVTVLDSSESNDDGSGAVSIADQIASRVSAAEAAK